MTFHQSYDSYCNGFTYRRLYVFTDLTFQCIDINLCVLWKRTTKIEHPLKRKMVIYVGRSAVADSHKRGRWSWAVMEPIHFVSGTGDSTNKQLITMFSSVVEWRAVSLLYLPRSLAGVHILFFIQLTSRCIVVSIAAVYVFPFRVVSMSAVRYKLIGGLPMCLRLIMCQGCIVICIFMKRM